MGDRCGSLPAACFIGVVGNSNTCAITQLHTAPRDLASFDSASCRMPQMLFPWKISLELLHKKTGASSHSREFKSMIRELVQNDHLPDYQVSIEDEMVIFRNRMNWQASKEQPRYPVLDPEAYHDAKLVAPGYDVYYLESEWCDMWVASGMPEIGFPGTDPVMPRVPRLRDGHGIFLCCGQLVSRLCG